MDCSAQPMDVLLKIDCDGDLRRALLKGGLSFAAIDRAIQEIWPQQSVKDAQYVDESGATCMLTQDNFSEFLNTAKVTDTATVLELQCCSCAPMADDPVDKDAITTAEDAFAMPWQHVEQGNEGGEESLYTVIDLTDMDATRKGEDMAAASTREASPAADDDEDESSQHNDEAQQKASPRSEATHTTMWGRLWYGRQRPVEPASEPNSPPAEEEEAVAQDVEQVEPADVQATTETEEVVPEVKATTETEEAVPEADGEEATLNDARTTVWGRLWNGMRRPAEETADAALPLRETVECGEQATSDEQIQEIVVAEMAEQQASDEAAVQEAASSVVAEAAAAAAAEQVALAADREAAAHRNFEDNIDIVLAAFDVDGDGYLSFEDCANLLNAACGDELPEHVFAHICEGVGAEPKKGLDREALVCIYCCGNSWMVLERDFEAAKIKLQGVAA